MNTVLVVDDEVDITGMLADLLADEGYRVLVAHHGAHALEVLERHGPVDLVVTDLMMPRMDGAELVRALRADARHRTLPVVLQSAGTGAREVARELGVPLLAKPYDLERFLTAIRHALDGVPRV